MLRFLVATADAATRRPREMSVKAIDLSEDVCNSNLIHRLRRA